MSGGSPRLPPANPALRAASKSGLKPSILRFKDKESPARLNREIGRLDPRFQCLEDEISALREQIPPEFGAQLAALRRDIDAAASSMLGSADTPIPDPAQLEALKSTVSERITKVFANFRTTDLEKGIAAAVANKSPVEPLLFRENDEPNATAGEIEALQQTLLRNARRHERRLTGAKTRLQRMSFDPPPLKVFESVHKLSDDVDGQRIQLSGLRIEIQRTRREIEKQVVRRKDEIKEALFRSPEGKILYQSLVPDLSSTMRQFSIDVEFAKAELAASIQELRALTERNEREERELLDLAEQCAVSVHLMEVLYRESQSPLRQICDQADQLENILKDLTNEGKCEALSAELEAKNQELGVEIQALKQKLASLAGAVS
jgi:hypothetical protein